MLEIILLCFHSADIHAISSSRKLAMYEKLCINIILYYQKIRMMVVIKILTVLQLNVHHIITSINHLIASNIKHLKNSKLLNLHKLYIKSKGGMLPTGLSCAYCFKLLGIVHRLALFIILLCLVTSFHVKWRVVACSRVQECCLQENILSQINCLFPWYTFILERDVEF